MTGRTHEGRRNRETDGRREEREQCEGDRQAENERQTERETKSVKERVDSAARTEREKQVERERERELGQRARHTVPYQGSVTVPRYIARPCTPAPASDNRLCFTGKPPWGRRWQADILTSHYGNTQRGTGYIAFHAL